MKTKHQDTKIKSRTGKRAAKKGGCGIIISPAIQTQIQVSGFCRATHLNKKRQPYNKATLFFGNIKPHEKTCGKKRTINRAAG